jgi:carboxyl-terminal processing protease
MLKKVFWIGLTLLTAITLSLTWWTPDSLAFTEEQKLLLQSWRIVNQSYVDDSFNHQNWWLMRQKYIKKPLGDREQTYKAIEEMLASLDDPYTRLLKPDQYHGLQISTSGELSGVGLQIGLDSESGYVEVISPLSGSPAEIAGIESHDRILEIDGVSTKTISLDEAAAKMRGQIGTKVSLKIQPHGKDTKDFRMVDVLRERISLNPVYANLDKQSGIGIGYIRLNQFSANAATEISRAVDKLEKQGADAYILDLRNNPGGLLQAGVEIARLWLNEGTIVYTVNREGTMGSFDSATSAITQDPLVVLVNQGTASASEILAGALQDNDRAILIGEKTFGKGLIQSLFELPDGAGLAITVAKYETPAHRDINKLGIVPNEVVSQDPITYAQIGTEADKQYQKALQLLSSKSIVASKG